MQFLRLFIIGKKDSGFSLVGALVGASISILVLFAIMTTNVRVLKSAKRTRDLLSTTKILSDLISYLGDPDICTGTFKGEKESDRENDFIKIIKRDSSAGNIKVFPYVSGDVGLVSIQIASIDRDAKTADLILHLESQTGESLLKESEELKIHSVELDNDEIKSCIAKGSALISDVACEGNTYLKGFDQNGDEICEEVQIEMADIQDIANLSCPENKYLGGVDSTGAPVCVDINAPLQELLDIENIKCDPGYVFAGFENGTVKCVEGGEPERPCQGNRRICGSGMNAYTSVCIYGYWVCHRR